MSVVVLLSGGQDSAICLMWARLRWGTVTALSVDYGQRHAVELSAAARIATWSGARHLTVQAHTLSGGALADHSLELSGEGDMPNSWEPGRNLLLIALAVTMSPDDIVIGACQADYSGYPDCRSEFIESAENSATLAMGRPVRIHAPLMFLSKAESIDLATRISGGWEAIGMSTSCYRGTRCGLCPACVLRRDGFASAGKVDPAG